MTAKEYTSTIDGLNCQTLPGNGSGEYPVIFQRKDATLEQIEGVHWDKPTLGGKFNTLPKGYGFTLKNIEYTSCDSSFHVTVQAQEQYWGDVTALTKEVEAKEKTIQEQAGEIEKAGQALEEKTAELREATDLIQGIVDAEVEDIMAEMGGDE